MLTIYNIVRFFGLLLQAQANYAPPLSARVKPSQPSSRDHLPWSGIFRSSSHVPVCLVWLVCTPAHLLEPQQALHSPALLMAGGVLRKGHGGEWWCWKSHSERFGKFAPDETGQKSHQGLERRTSALLRPLRHDSHFTRTCLLKHWYLHSCCFGFFLHQLLICAGCQLESSHYFGVGCPATDNFLLPCWRTEVSLNWTGWRHRDKKERRSRRNSK